MPGSRRSRKLRTLADVDSVDRLPSVLVVDDDPDVRLVLDEFLAAHGFEVTTVATGEEADSLLASDARIDLVVLDLVMPGMSGLEVLARMRARRERDSTQVMVVAAQPPEKIEGAQAILSKPVILGDLLETIEELARPVAPPLAVSPGGMLEKTLEEIANGRDDANGTLRAAVAKLYAGEGEMEEAAYWYICAAEHADRKGQARIANSWRTLANLTAPAGAFGRLSRRKPQ